MSDELLREFDDRESVLQLIQMSIALQFGSAIFYLHIGTICIAEGITV